MFTKSLARESRILNQRENTGAIFRTHLGARSWGRATREVRCFLLSCDLERGRFTCPFWRGRGELKRRPVSRRAIERKYSSTVGLLRRPADGKIYFTARVIQEEGALFPSRRGRNRGVPPRHLSRSRVSPRAKGHVI